CRLFLQTQLVEVLFILPDLRLEVALLSGKLDEADQAEEESESDGAGGNIGRNSAAFFAAEEIEENSAGVRGSERPGSATHRRGQQDQHEREQRHQCGSDEIPARMFAEQIQEVHYHQPF